MFGQPARRSPDHHTNSAGAWEEEKEWLDWSPVAIFSNLSAPQTTMSPRERVSAHAQLWKGASSMMLSKPGKSTASIMPESCQSPGRPREGSGSRQLTRDRWHSPPPAPSQQRLQKAPEATVDLLSIPTPTPAHKVTAKVEAKNGKKKKKKPTKLRFGLKSSLSFLIFSKTANYVIHERSLAGESA